MSRYQKLLCGLAASLAVLLVQPVWAEDPATPPTPEEIAQKAIARVTEIADRTTTAIQTETDKVVARIKELLDQGEKVKARRLGLLAVHRIRVRSVAAGMSIVHVGERAGKAIKDGGGGDDLITQVRDAVKAQTARIRAAAQAATEAIKAALPKE